jgi:trans-aconitate methyltransferase
VHFDCIDHDQKAIDFASNLCRAFADRVRFIRSNVVRLHRGKQYDLIWAAGLFDYFNDASFKRVLRRLLGSIEPDGELVIGNFSPNNPNIAWLRFVDWHLHHRSEDQLRALAIESGVRTDRIRIGQEPEGVNLFLHIHN